MKFLSQLVTSASGKIGGIVASRNAAGSYFRSRVKPTNPKTLAQSGARSQFATASKQWQNLTDSVRGAWKMWAAEHPKRDRLGVTVARTGQQEYVGQWIANTAAAVAVAVTPPPGDRVTPPVFASATISAATGVGSFTLLAAPPTGAKLTLSCTPVLPPGRAFLGKPSLRVPSGTISGMSGNFTLTNIGSTSFSGGKVQLGGRYCVAGGVPSEVTLFPGALA